MIEKINIPFHYNTKEDLIIRKVNEIIRHINSQEEKPRSIELKKMKEMGDMYKRYKIGWDCKEFHIDTAGTGTEPVEEPTEELKKKLENANNVCWDCWKKYWEYKWWAVWCWKANCDICGKEDSCCAPRDWKFFKKTLYPKPIDSSNEDKTEREWKEARAKRFALKYEDCAREITTLYCDYVDAGEFWIETKENRPFDVVVLEILKKYFI